MHIHFSPSRQHMLWAVGLALLAAVLMAFPARAQDEDADALPGGPATTLPDEVDATPGLVPFSNLQSLSADEEGACAITRASALFCWGNGFNGQNGTGTTDFKATPAAVTTLSNVVQVSRGAFHSCAVTAAGRALCWGTNSSGQVGDGTNDQRLLPTEAISTGVRSISAGGAFTCAVKTNGQVWCWGDNTYGQLGTGSAGGTSNVPVQVVGVSTATALDSAVFHTCALLGGGQVACWGNNSSGQIGNGAFATEVPNATLAQLPEAVVQVTAGGTTSCARTAAGKVYCWGDNAAGQLGTFDNPTDHNTPIAPQSLETGIVAIDTNSSHTCALSVTGQTYCWGSNLAGQLGAGVGPGGPSKLSVMGLPAAVRSISVGVFHTCALLIDDRAVCWGSNQGNALGDGTNLDSLVPIYVRTQSTCFQLSLAQVGTGAAPQVTPLNGVGCPLHHYAAGTQLSLSAMPAALARVQSWSAPVAFQAGGTLALLSMPNADTTATVTYAACRLLTRSHTGNGGNPTPSFGQSSGCPAGRFAVGEVILLAATPSTNQRVQAWTGTAIEPGLGLPVNSVVMPDADRTVNTAYEACNVLSIAVSGQGDLPGVFPAASSGCPAGTFVTGESIQLTAAPAAGWRIAAWSGTANDASTAVTNALVMPAGPRQVTVAYAPQMERVMLPLVNR